MAETKQYLDYNGLIKIIGLIQTTFPTKEITAEALDQINQCLTELIDGYNNHSHTIEEQSLDISYSNNKLVINSIHTHQLNVPSKDHQVETPLPLPESLRPNGGGGSTIDYSKEYFTLHMLGDGNMTLYMPSSYTTAPSYSVNGGEWTTFTSETTLSLKSDDKVRVKCVTGAYQRGFKTMFNGTYEYDVYGNVMSLLYGDNFEGQTSLTTQYSFRSLFYNQTKSKNAENLILPATTLADSCYYAMFERCTSLTTAPELPATVLAVGCYDSMFFLCKSLTTAPTLPATVLAVGCYNSMFKGCTSLTTVQTILPATILADSCYCEMFDGCTSLSTSPELPATILAKNCYLLMFYGCALTTAPELPATTLADSCYNSMFKSCSKLNKITMLATDISTSNDLYEWVYGVASNGTFIKHPNMTSLPTGTSGIPSGWTVQDYQG